MLTTVLPSPGVGASTVAVAPMSRGGDVVTGLLGLWLIGGMLLDGWAHEHLARLETFFTPWHAVLYSGFAATAAWLAWSGWTRRRDGLAWWRSFPPGYGLGAGGVALFLLAGIGDLEWHTAFGIERGDAALLSPTHLGLMTGAVLMLTTPLRSASATRRDRFVRPEVVLPTALAMVAVAFLTHLLDPFWLNPISTGRRDQLAVLVKVTTLPANLSLASGLGAFVVTTLLLFGPLVVMAKRWRLPAWAVILHLGLMPVLLQAVRGFDDPGIAALGVIGALVAATVVSFTGRLRTPHAPSAGLVVAAPAYWATYMAGVAIADHGLGWRAELWGGTLVWTALTVLATIVVASGTPSALPGGPAEAHE